MPSQVIVPRPFSSSDHIHQHAIGTHASHISSTHFHPIYFCHPPEIAMVPTQPSPYTCTETLGPANAEQQRSVSNTTRCQRDILNFFLFELRPC